MLWQRSFVCCVTIGPITVTQFLPQMIPVLSLYNSYRLINVRLKLLHLPV